MAKVALITGANSFLGTALVEKFVKEGFKVYGSVRSRKENIKSRAVSSVILDITREEETRKAVEAIIKKEKKIDVLVNNAGYTVNGPSEDYSPQDYMDILNTNAVGAFRLIKHVLPHMKRQRAGRIINITSLNGLVPLPNFAIYCSSKHAIEALGMSLRYELLKYGICLTNVAPGAVYNPLPKSTPIKNYKPVRDRFKILYFLLPMATREKVASSVCKVAKSTYPPSRVLVGTDAHIISLLYRILPTTLWDMLIRFIWSSK